MTGAGTIWWDFDGTLVSRPFMWAEAGRRALDRYRAGHAISDHKLIDALATGMPWHRVGHDHAELRTADLWWQSVYDRYLAAFDEAGCYPPLQLHELATIRADILDARRYTLFDDVEAVLRELARDGWRQMIVSNHVPELAQIVDDLGIGGWFSAVVTSGVVGYEKPHRRLFEAALEHVIPDAPVWMIGDNVDTDCTPVAEFGVDAIHVRTAQTQAHGRWAEGLRQVLPIVTGRSKEPARLANSGQEQLE